MGFLIDTKNRSDAIEIMDDFSLEGEHLYNTLDQLANINKWLGGNSVTLNGLKDILKNHAKDKELVIVDLGCGNGDMLRIVHDYLTKNNFIFKLIGIDANSSTIDYATQLSKGYPKITYLQQDILSKGFKTLKYDVVLATLFIHHFKEDQIIELLDQQLKTANMAIIINDLHRHWLAYYLFKGLSLFIKNPMVKQDGLISILRGFKRKELKRMSKKLNAKSEINWRWAFRFQWIIQK